MYTTIRSFYAFAHEFHVCGRGDQFSTEALRILFDYLEQYEEDTGESVELDVVALCCDYNEMSWREVADNYCIPGLSVLDEDEAIDEVRAYLEDNTALCGEFEGPEGVTFVFQVF